MTRDRRDGHDVYYGDASDPKFLEICGLGEAAGVIITIHTHDLIDDVVEHVRAMRAGCPHRRRARATPIMRAIFTSSAPPTRCRKRSKRACSFPKPRWSGLASPTGPVIASIHEKRDEIRHALQQAARDAGRGDTRAIRAKSKIRRLSYAVCGS